MHDRIVTFLQSGFTLLAVGIGAFFVPVQCATVVSVCLLFVSLKKFTRIERLISIASAASGLGANPMAYARATRLIEIAATLSQLSDPIHKELAEEQLGLAETRLKTLATGEVQFQSTEQWRTTYEELLTSPGLHLYRSVSWVRDAGYWQQEAGLNSIQLNQKLAETGKLNIERTVILSDDVWNEPNRLPSEPVSQWIHEQHSYGIRLWLVREAELVSESDLLVDIGIYGTRATGTQELADDGGTRQFTLQFGFEHVKAAEEKWHRLMVHAVKYSDFLDRYSVSS